jgi:hypothetical protein
MSSARANVVIAAIGPALTRERRRRALAQVPLPGEL